MVPCAARSRRHATSPTRERERRLERLTRTLAAIRNVNQLIAREKDPRILVEQTCKLLIEKRGYLGSWIAMRGVPGLPEHVAHAGWDEAFSAHWQRVQQGGLPGCCARASAAPDGIALLEPRRECGACPLALAYGANSAAVLAFGHARESLGFLGVVLPANVSCDDEEKALLREVADDIAFALADIRTQRQQEMYAKIVGSSSEAMALIDRDLRYLEANPSYLHLAGFSQSSIKGQRVRDVLGPELFEQVRGPLLRCLEGEEMRFEASRKAKDGRERFLEIAYSPCRLPDGRIEAVAVWVRDNTELVQSRRAREEAEERFRLFFEHAPIGKCMTAPDGRLIEVNQAFCDMLGRTREEMLEFSFVDTTHPDDLPVSNECVRMLLSGERDSYEMDKRYLAKDGRIVWTHVTTHLHRLPDGVPMFFLTHIQDVSEQRRLQASLTQADRLASMGMLAAGVAHEINNPLSFVLYNLESVVEDIAACAAHISSLRSLLAERLGADAAREVVEECGRLLDGKTPTDFLDRIRDVLEGAERIKKVVRGLNVFSRVEGERVEPVDLSEAVESALVICQNELRYRAQVVLDLGVTPPVQGSVGRLSQVFLNLLINAAHAISEGAVEKNKVTIRTFQEGEMVVAEVIDTGCGIAREHLAKIFDPFFTTKPRGVGSGLGLSISREIVENYGGEIVAESEVGKGARFRVRLPIAQPSPREATGAAPTQTPPVPGPGGRILVVDDEPQVRGIIRRILSRHEVEEAGSGREAQAILTRDSGFDVILCDMMMTEMSGIDLHKWLLAQRPVLAERVVFITGGAFTPDARAYLESVPNLRIEKPFDSLNLRKLVDEWVVRARSKT